MPPAASCGHARAGAPQRAPPRRGRPPRRRPDRPLEVRREACAWVERAENELPILLIQHKGAQKCSFFFWPFGLFGFLNMCCGVFFACGFWGVSVFCFCLNICYVFVPPPSLRIQMSKQKRHLSKENYLFLNVLCLRQGFVTQPGSLGDLCRRLPRQPLADPGRS